MKEAERESDSWETVALDPKFKTSIERQVSGDKLQYRVTGELDNRTTPVLKDDSVRLFSADEALRFIEIDLSQTIYIDSTFVGYLVNLKRRVKDREGDVLLIIDDPRLRNVFKTTGLDAVFPIRTSAELTAE